jgi:hypothetical protein
VDSSGEAVSYDSDSKQTISSLVGHLVEIEEAATWRPLFSPQLQFSFVKRCADNE